MTRPKLDDICHNCKKTYFNHSGVYCFENDFTQKFTTIPTESLPSMTNLPPYIFFTSPELALATASYLESKGWKRFGNLNSDRMETSKSFRGGIRVRCGKNTIENYNENVTWNGTDPKFSSLRDFIDEYLPKPIQIGDHIVEFSSLGIKVGCTSVSWELIEEILSRKPKA